MNDKGFKDLQNNFFYSAPKNVYAKSNLSYRYWFNYLMRLAISNFVFKDFPKEWDIDFFRETLFYDGYIGVTEHYKSGLVALNCSYSGQNIYRKPTRLIFTNPVIGTFNRKIGLNSELVFLDWHDQTFDSLPGICSRYAVFLANIDGSLNVSLINSRVAMVFTGSNKEEVKSAQKMYDDVTKGKPAVFRLTDNGLNNSLGEVFFNNVRNNYIGNDLLLTQQAIINSFCSYVGIDNVSVEKKERLVTEEVNSNNQMTKTLAEMWIDNINDCFDRVRLLYPNVKTKCFMRKIKNEI